MQLLPHQEIGRDFLVSHPRALLADGMRVGKSVQTITAAERIYWDSENLDFRTVVICPASLREQWRRQFSTFATWVWERTIVSYEEAAKDWRRIVNRRIDMLVLDESHYLKNRKAKRTEVIFEKIVPVAQRVWCLTGTPSPNNASELYPMLKALFPETIDRGDGKPMDYWSFVKKFCIVRETPFGQKIEGNRNTEELKRRMAPIMLRRPSSILGNQRLPDETLYLDVAKRELTRLEDDLKKELGAKYDLSPQLMDDKVKARIGRLTGLAKVPALVERLKDEFESGLDRVVLFAWHTDVILRLAAELTEFEPAVVLGATRDRQHAVDFFQTDPKCRVFIGQIKAAGVGLDLSVANELIFVETSWVPGDNDQAAMRISGVNQKRASRVRYAVLPGSIDERLMSVNRRKSEDTKALFG
jgi:SWI/SNF-related matrix-associated actin-dependent regulator 1 of chromatin subfamily A